MEHALHDRDNSLMGGDITFRIMDGIQLQASYLLDDIIFGEIGKGYWSNKSAWNFGLTYAMPLGFDIGIEYARVEPYAFSHFDSVNSYTNDEMLIGTGILPNSEELSLILKYWWPLSIHPLKLRLSYNKHGENEYDKDGNLTRNVGANPLQSKRSEDSEKVSFLDGDLKETFRLDIETSYELIRDFHIHGNYSLRNINGVVDNIIYLTFSFEDF